MISNIAGNLSIACIANSFVSNIIFKYTKKYYNIVITTGVKIFIFLRVFPFEFDNWAKSRYLAIIMSLTRKKNTIIWHVIEC